MAGFKDSEARNTAGEWTVGNVARGLLKNRLPGIVRPGGQGDLAIRVASLGIATAINPVFGAVYAGVSGTQWAINRVQDKHRTATAAAAAAIEAHDTEVQTAREQRRMEYQAAEAAAIQKAAEKKQALQEALDKVQKKRWGLIK